MFEPYSRERLESLLSEFPVTASGCAYIFDALAAPSRNVAGSTRNVVSHLPNPKMGFRTQSVSASGIYRPTRSRHKPAKVRPDDAVVESA